MSRTPGPWEARIPPDRNSGYPPHVVKIAKDEQGRRTTTFIASCESAPPEIDNAANAAFIVLACNAHERLVESLRERQATACRTSCSWRTEEERRDAGEHSIQCQKARAVLAEMEEG